MNPVIQHEDGAELRERAASYRLGGPSSEHTAALLDRAADALDALQAERDELDRKFTIEWTRAREFLNRAEAAEARVTALKKGLEPFADIAGEMWADENGWTDAACPNDRIGDWFGPSAFRAARALLNPKEGASDAG